MALSGPTLAPAKGPATHLVVLVHGYGADGNDLIGLAQHWQQAVADRGLCRAQCAHPRAGHARAINGFPSPASIRMK